MNNPSCPSNDSSRTLSHSREARHFRVQRALSHHQQQRQLTVNQLSSQSLSHSLTNTTANVLPSNSNEDFNSFQDSFDANDLTFLNELFQTEFPILEQLSIAANEECQLMQLFQSTENVQNFESQYCERLQNLLLCNQQLLSIYGQLSTQLDCATDVSTANNSTTYSSVNAQFTPHNMLKLPHLPFSTSDSSTPSGSPRSALSNSSQSPRPTVYRFTVQKINKINSNTFRLLELDTIKQQLRIYKGDAELYAQGDRRHLEFVAIINPFNLISIVTDSDNEHIIIIRLVWGGNSKCWKFLFNAIELVKQFKRQMNSFDASQAAR